MKKILLCAAVISAFSFASCKKDRTCTCTGTSTFTTTTVTDWETSPTTTATTSNGGSGGSTTIYTEAKKSDAKKACVNTSSEDTDVDVDSGTTYNMTSGNIEDYTTTTTTKYVTSGTCDLK
ncbi:MAG: hypothetical protein V4608_14140 [Bacteroidota bacterium]